MKNILFISDGLITREEIFGKELGGLLKALDKFDVDIDVALDITPQKFGENPSEFVMRIEHEGPEWVDPGPEVMEKIVDADIVVTHFSGVNSTMIDAAKNLQLIGVMRSGVENVNLDAATKRGITVINSPGRVSEPVADFTVGLLLNEVRSISKLASELSTGVWPGFDRDNQVNTILRGRTAGIIGFGIIGRKVTKRLAAFGTKVIAYDPYANPDVAAAMDVELVNLEDLLKQSDYVLMHARLSEATENLMGEKEFALMKPNAIFINTARAGLVDENALISALQEKRIHSAALDVFRQEPLPEGHPFFELDNVTLTPHRSGGTRDTKVLTFSVMIDQLVEYLETGALPNKMN